MILGEAPLHGSCFFEHDLFATITTKQQIVYPHVF